MKKTKLTLGEIITLESEISGLTNQQTGEVVLKGLLGEKINLVIKYHLSKLTNSFAADKKILEELRDELIKKYGEETDNGGIIVTQHLDEAKTIINPKFVQFAQEYETLLSEQKEIEHSVITLEDIKDINSEGRYSVFFKLIDSDITTPTEEV
jgi:molybdopterin converting factor small subunit